MATESEVKLARYSEVAKESDVLGRVIGVRRLKPSEQTKLAGMTAELTGYDEMLDNKGEKIQISHRMPMVIASAVCYISDNNGEAHISFPRNRGELDAIYDRLDMEGLKAAGIGFVRLQGGPRTDNQDQINDPANDSKNL